MLLLSTPVLSQSPNADHVSSNLQAKHGWRDLGALADRPGGRVKSGSEMKLNEGIVSEGEYRTT